MTRRNSNGIVTDLLVSDQGSMVLLIPLTAAAFAWFDEHVATESWQWLGDSLAVDQRYADDIINQGSK